MRPLSRAPALSRAPCSLARAPARACRARACSRLRARGVPCAVRARSARALLRCLERMDSGSHDGDESERRHEDASRRHRRFWCANTHCPVCPPHAPCTISNAVVAGGAFAGTLATHALAPAPALEESFVAAEKMEPAFKVCAPCSLAAQSPAISALYPPDAPPSNLMLLAAPSLLAHTHTHMDAPIPICLMPLCAAW